MKLRDFIRLHNNDEVEVYDKYLDTIPYYVSSDYAFNDTEDEKNFRLMEDWIQSLEVENVRGTTCNVDVYSQVEKRFEDTRDDEYIIGYTEDVFTTLSQGFYGFAELFCEDFNLKG